MASVLMNDLHVIPGVARLEAHTARRLPAARHSRWLSVLQGQVWLTTDGHDDTPGEDVWLTAGEAWLLEGGAGVVLQAEQDARLQLVEAAPLAVSAAWPARVATAWARLRAGLRAWAERQGMVEVAPPCAAC